MRTGILAVGLIAAVLASGGCAIMHLGGAMAQAWDEQKLVEKLPRYDGLENKTVAVIVDAPLEILYEHPDVVGQITTGITYRIGRDVPGARVVVPENVIAWQWQNPDWNTMAYGELAETLNVDRVVHVDLYEFRLNPPGNSWLWDGVCAASVSVIERDGFDPDVFADTFDIVGKFPDVEGVERSQAQASQIQTGVLAEFIKKSVWLFYKHLEPKHPDKYRPELDRT